MADQADIPKNKKRQGPPGRWSVLLVSALLALLVVVVYFPVLGFDFIDWDVYAQVVQNQYIRGLTLPNIKHILTTRCITSYYPVRTLTFAANYQIAGLNPWIYKLSNVSFHLGNVLLVFWLILRLCTHPAARASTRGRWWDLTVAAFGAGIYAVHPVTVEPATWVPGREELLLVTGSLGCIHFHMTARRLSREQGSRRGVFACYIGSAVCALAGCLSNAVGAVIPLLITAFDLLTLPRPKLWKTFTGVWPLWIIGAGTIISKRLGEGDIPIKPAMFTLDRTVIVLDVYAHNLKTLFWPTQLSLYYDWVFPKGFLEQRVILGGVAVVLTFVVLWLVRRQTLLLYCLLWFGLAMGPVAQIMPHHIQRADRFLYLPLVGLAAAAALAVRSLGARKVADDARQSDAPPPIDRVLSYAWVLLGVLLLTVLAYLSRGQLYTWRNSFSAWEHCLWIDPNNGRAHDAFADNLAVIGRMDQAIAHYEKALEIHPNSVETLKAYSMQLATSEEGLRNFERATELGIRANELTKWDSKETRENLSLIFSYRAVDFQRKRDYGQAIQTYRNALRVMPGDYTASFNLALLLATCPDRRLRRPGEAVDLAEKACETPGNPAVNDLLILATAYAAAEQFQMAVLTIDRAAATAQRAGREELATELRQQRQRYENKQPLEQLPRMPPIAP